MPGPARKCQWCTQGERESEMEMERERKREGEREREKKREMNVLIPIEHLVLPVA